MANQIIVANMLQKEVIKHLDKALVFFPWANTKYEGELKKAGTTVEVQMFPNITWTTGGTAGNDITATDWAITSETMTVSQVAQVNLKIEDINEVRSNLDLMSGLAERMAYGRADLLDQHIADTAAAGALAANKLNTGGTAPTPTTIYAAIEAIVVALDAQNVPQDGRALFIDPATSSILRQANIYDATSDGLAVRTKGYVGMVSGMNIYKTNNYPTGTGTKFMVAMGKNPVNFVAQLNKMKITDAEKGFYSNLLGEIVYQAHVFAEHSKTIATYEIPTT